MSNLKSLRTRIEGVKSTQKITKAMRMVAAAKLMRSRKKLQNSIIYSNAITNMTANLMNSSNSEILNSPITAGTGRRKSYLLVVVNSDKGLCGSYNINIFKQVKSVIESLERENIATKIFVIGNRGCDFFDKNYTEKLIGQERDISGKLTYEKSFEIASKISSIFLKEEFDFCDVIYNQFKSVMTQDIVRKQLFPIDFHKNKLEKEPIYLESEPDSADLLEDLLPSYLAAQINDILLNSLCSEYGARMTAMENATNNTDSLIKDLTLIYNRTRQALITKELIEIISGAEALNG